MKALRLPLWLLALFTGGILASMLPQPLHHLGVPLLLVPLVVMAWALKAGLATRQGGG